MKQIDKESRENYTPSIDTTYRSHDLILPHYIQTPLSNEDLAAFSEIIDVRAPSEYATDHLQGAINLPVLDDAQRAEIGTLHRQSPFEARRLGAQYVTQRTTDLLRSHFAAKPADYRPLLYCWRGGMRSGSLATILRSIGWGATLIRGGYQALRKQIVQQIESYFLHPDLQLKVITGLTGVGKTLLLKTLAQQGHQVIDLEALANHKGSLLGASPDAPQPSQKYFESQLWDHMRSFDLSQPIYLEAESNRIGNIHCPSPLWAALHHATTIELDLPIKERVKLLLDEYPHFPDKPKRLLGLLDHLVRLRGHEQINLWKKSINDGDWHAFVESILIHHYDKAYRRAGEEKSNYQTPTTTISVSAFSPAAFEQAANEVLKV